MFTTVPMKKLRWTFFVQRRTLWFIIPFIWVSSCPGKELNVKKSSELTQIRTFCNRMGDNINTARSIEPWRHCLPWAVELKFIKCSLFHTQPCIKGPISGDIVWVSQRPIRRAILYNPDAKIIFFYSEAIKDVCLSATVNHSSMHAMHVRACIQNSHASAMNAYDRLIDGIRPALA